MRKIYLLASMMAIFTITLAMTTTTVKAVYNNTFFVNVDPFTLGWTYLPGIDPLYGENIYKDIGTGTGNVGKVQAGDVRLTPVANGEGGFYAAGSIVALGDYDYSTLANLKTTYGVGVNMVKHTENVAVDTYYSYGEFMYKDADQLSTVSIGDTRYSRVGVYKVGSIVAEGDTDIGQALTTFKPAATGVLEKYTDNMLANSLYDHARLFVDIMWTTDIVDNSADGMRGWQVTTQVDPNVLTPLAITGAVTGYVLNDYVTNWGIGLTTGLVGSITYDSIDASEQILGDVTTGAGDASGGAMTPMKLVTLIFIPQSLMEHSTIRLLASSLGYQTPDLPWHAVTLVDGSYNVPVVPEFPLGLGIIMALAPIIPIVYIWRLRKNKPKLLTTHANPKGLKP
jgi:hypothetical protein